MGRNTWRQVAGFAFSVAGVVVLTLAIAWVRTRVDVPNLSLVYLLLVLWLGARFGVGPAIGASVLAFLAYDYFFVPPVGTLTVSAPRELLGLILLLAAALVTGQLAASVRRSGELANESAAEARTLYELATAALKVSEVEAALQIVADKAGELGLATRFAVVATAGGGQRALAGGDLPDDVAQQARWAFEHRTPVGIQVDRGEARLVVVRPRRPQDALLPLSNGVIWIRSEGELGTPRHRALLAALLSLAGLLLDRWVAQEEAQRLRALEASDQLKTGILSSISHELKTPLAVLRTGLTSLSRPAAGLTGDQRLLVEGLDREAARLDRLVGDLLTMSRLEAGEPVRLQPADFKEVLGAVLHALQLELAPFQVRTEIPARLPLAAMDEQQIERVLGNLIDNACDWTPPGGHICIGARALARDLQVWVENEGPGIPTRELDAIFEKFWTKRRGGTGLGLAICKRVVEAHGGSIHARNLRSGPRLEFTLPLAAVAGPV